MFKNCIPFFIDINNIYRASLVNVKISEIVKYFRELLNVDFWINI